VINANQRHQSRRPQIAGKPYRPFDTTGCAAMHGPEPQGNLVKMHELVVPAAGERTGMVKTQKM
jgi:hypothetical protein